MHEGLIGYIDTPAQGNKRPDGVTWVADNGCYSPTMRAKGIEWDWRKWWAFLTNNADRADSCLFATAPDVVGDAAATLEKSAPWLPQIRALGYRVALVAQDGLEDLPVPWDDFDALFIGGTTEWKKSGHAIALAAEAKARGKWVHAGRINSERRFRYAAAPAPYGLGADSADGTFLVHGPDVNLPKVLSWARGVAHPAFDFGATA